MPRKPRMYVAGLPCHVIQRGNNRNPVFFNDQDRRFYLSCLAEACERYRVAIHAYVLMTNHVHLLMTPLRSDGVSRVMQSLGRRYVQVINRLHGRTGTLWEGRHRATVVHAEDYLLACSRYIELNPVRACMVDHPGDYLWSSYHANACGRADPLVTPHACYLALGPDAASRQRQYRAMFQEGLHPQTIHFIRRTTNCSVPMGGTRFITELEAKAKRHNQESE